MSAPQDRRHVLKKWIMGGCALAWGGCTLHHLLVEPPSSGLRVGFRNDAPEELGAHAREAAWYAAAGSLIHCQLCPHDCMLGENDRGFCRTRVVKDGRLHTLAYGNPCAAHVDPVEKKPLHHFLPGTSILSIATAGCNLRCLNCQNWQISQSRPEDTRNRELWPERLVEVALERGIPSIAYTYSEPIIFYEYVRDTATLARERGIRNVLVTAGYIHEAPLREICRVVDAANVDLKAMNDRFYKKIAGARLDPVLRALEVMRAEGLWIEVTRLLVPTWSDDLDDVRKMCRWIVRHLGAETPLHLSRFHPAYKLQGLPPTPAGTLEQAGEIAREEGLHYVFIGNVPGHEAQVTICPRCGLEVIERRGYHIETMLLQGGCCPCGTPIPGVWT